MNMSKKREITSIGLALLVAVAIFAGLPFIPAIRYRTSDELTRVAIDTKQNLANYEQTGNPSKIHQYINSCHNADQQQSLIILANWSMTHQVLFIRFVASMNDSERDLFIGTFAFVIVDSGQYKQFCRAFHGYNSQIIKTIIDRANNLCVKH